MKILVTGSTGFLGSSLTKILLNSDFKILALSRKKKKDKDNLKFIKDDIKLTKKLKIIKIFKPEAIVHLAWEGIPNFDKINLSRNLHDQKVFFKKILKLKSIKKIVVTGSCLEYKNRIGKCSEYDNLTNSNNFGLTKIKLYNFIKKKLKKNTNFYWLRPFYIYGKNQRKGSLIPKLILSIKKKKKIILQNAFNSNDYINVKDVSMVIKKILLTKPKTGIYNIGYGKAFSVIKVIKILEKLSKKKIMFKSLKKKEEYSFYSDNKKIKKNLNILPKINLKKGLSDLIKTHGI